MGLRLERYPAHNAVIASASYSQAGRSHSASLRVAPTEVPVIIDRVAQAEVEGRHAADALLQFSDERAVTLRPASALALALTSIALNDAAGAAVAGVLMDEVA